MRSKWSFFALFTLVAVQIMSTAASAQQTGYKLVDIGTFGGPVSYILPAAQIGYGINASLSSVKIPTMCSTPQRARAV